jgi:type IV secretion system protein TrbL
MGVVSCVENPASCVGHAVGKVASNAAGDAFDTVAKDFAQFAEHATTWVWQQLDAATAVQLSGGQWNGVLQVTVEIGVVVCVLMLLLQVISSALRHDMGGLGRAFQGVAIAMIGTFASFIVTDSLLSAVDALSSGVMQQLSGTTAWTELGDKVIHAQTLSSGAIGSAAMLLCAILLLLSSLIVWLALVVRKMLVIIGAAFAPIAFGGAPFDVTSAWVRRWIEFTLALIFSKLILVILFGIGLQIELGLGQVGSGVTQQVTQMMTGVLVMAIAGFAPWMAIQFVHWAGGGLQQLQQHGQVAAAGGQAAIAAPQRMYSGAQAGFSAASGAASRLAGGAGGSGSSGGSNGGGGEGGGGGGGGGGQGRTDGGGAPGGGTKESGPGGVVAGAAVSAFEAGKSQTAQALGANDVASGDGHQNPSSGSAQRGQAERGQRDGGQQGSDGAPPQGGGGGRNSDEPGAAAGGSSGGTSHSSGAGGSTSPTPGGGSRNGSAAANPGRAPSGSPAKPSGPGSGSGAGLGEAAELGAA